MRYYKILAEISLMALALASCAKEQQSEALVVQPGQELTITATSGDPETRTERASDGAVLWSPGDQISLFYGSGTGGGSCFTAQNTETAKVANFTGTIGVITGGNDVSVEDTYFWATYPYNATTSCDGASVTTVLPSEQVATPDTFADDLFPSIGRSQGLNMAFYNICGGLKFTVSEEGIKSVTLKGNNGEQLAGRITVGFGEDDRPAVTGIADGSETITVSAPAGETFEVGRSYYIVLVPTVFESGFTLTFSKGYAEATYERAKKTTIKRSSFGTLTTPDAGLEWTMLYVQIPDENFRAYMIQHFDSNGDGELDELEAAAVKIIDDLNTDSISSLTGIESLVNIERLRCLGGRSIGVKDNYENYTYYSGGTGQLTSLDLSHNPLLKYVNCSNNKITDIVLCNNTLLEQLYCGYNLLEELDLSANTALINLNCNGNQKLKTLDLSNNKELRVMNFMYNDIPSIDLSEHTKLEQVGFSMGHLACLDISGCSSLQQLNYHEGRLETLRIGKNTALTYMNIWGNQLTSLDLSSCPALASLYCDSNQLTSLNVSDNANLIVLRCDDNQLTSLDVSANTSLTYLSCDENRLTILDVSGCSSLATLKCSSNPYLSEIWLNLGQTIESFEYDRTIAAIKYRGVDYESGLPSEITSADVFIDWLLKSNITTTGEYVITVPEIDLAGKTIYSSEGFSGTLDGNGCVIKNLVCSRPLFNTLLGTVKNLVFDSSCSFNSEVATFGIVAGVNNGSISNVTNKANVLYSASSINEPALIAAIAGQSSGSIVDCVNEGTISIVASGSTKGLGVAGIVAYQSSVIDNCINRGSVSFSAASISGKTTVVAAENALPSAGGVCAIGAPGFSMEDCSNYGKVSFSVAAANNGLTSNLNRSQIGGVVASPCGDVRGCKNLGEVNVSIKHSTPGTALPFEFIACVGGIGGGDYLFTNSTDRYFNSSYYDCTNEGTIIVDSDASKSNTAVGGIVGWPGQERSGSGYAEGCVNKGAIIGRGVMKCRLGGISGGTGQMFNCNNQGTVKLESGDINSALGALCGFHSQVQNIADCIAGGEVISEVPNVVGGISGFIGNVGNVENYFATGCVVNCKVTVATYDPQTVGMVVGRYNGTSRYVEIGSESNPIQVSGSINGTPASDNNIYGKSNDANHIIYYIIK